MASSLDSVLEYALQVGAVDLILAEGFLPALRIAGRVRNIPNAETLAFGDLERFLGPLGGESGSFRGGPWAKTEWRVRYFREAFGKAAVLRPVGLEAPELSALGFPGEATSLLGAESGLILFAGPMISGKTTTASAFVSELCTRRTLRASFLSALPEYRLRTGACLVQHKRAKVSQEDEILQGIRSGTDLFWLGDLDESVLLPAIRAAESGALVVATTTAGSARDVLAYLSSADLGESEKQVRAMLAASLRAIVFQRLVLSDDGKSFAPAWDVLCVDSSVAQLVASGEFEKISALRQV